MSAARTHWFCSLLGLAALAAMPAAAQVYRVVGPDGKITFSDRAPADPGVKAVTAPVVTLPSSALVANLPFELRQVATKFPVTLYTGPNCGPCGAARALLMSRGVPFTEKTVATNDDAQALQRLSGDSVLPFMTIGGQQLKGFAEGEWTQYIDAAGYPKTSTLPSSYRPAPASPLVLVQPAAERGAAAPTPVRRPATAPTPAPGPSPSNPAGIRF